MALSDSSQEKEGKKKSGEKKKRKEKEKRTGQRPEVVSGNQKEHSGSAGGLTSWREREREKREEGREEQETQQRQERNEIQAADIEQTLLSASAEQRQYWGEDVKKANVEIEKVHCCHASNKLNNRIFHKAS